MYMHEIANYIYKVQLYIKLESNSISFVLSNFLNFCATITTLQKLRSQIKFFLKKFFWVLNEILNEKTIESKLINH